MPLNLTPDQPYYVRRIEARFVWEGYKQYSLDTRLTEAKEVVALFRDLEDETVEKFMGFYLDNKGRPVCFSLISIGGLDSAQVSIREIIKPALLSGAKSLITIHNHTSGDSEPSPEDKAITQRIKEACQLMEISLLDHIIISKDGYYSFCQKNKL